MEGKRWRRQKDGIDIPNVLTNVGPFTLLA